MPVDQKISFGCCFCDQNVDTSKSLAIVAVNNNNNEDETVSQTWWAHPQCFNDSLNEKYREFRPEFQL